MKVISFSLWGNNPKYLVGMLRNAELAHKYYPEWTVRVYAGHIGGLVYREIPNFELWKSLLRLGCEFVPMDANPWCPPMMQRFLVADDPLVERFIVRDADSRLTVQEAAAVAEWEASDRILHSCRAHRAHGRPINGGMFGAMWRRANWQAPSMAELIKTYLEKHLPSYVGHDPDQDFLCRMIWPWARHSTIEHGLRFKDLNAQDWPLPWPPDRFMGQVVDVDLDGVETYRPD